jgi:resolvase-like protein
MFNVIGAMAEFERALIQERVRAGLRNARAKGKRIGRPRIAADGSQVAALRKTGSSWSEVCKQTGLSKGTAQRAYYAQKPSSGLPKNRCGPIPSNVRAAMGEGDALFVMHRDYRYAALVLPLHLDRWNGPNERRCPNASAGNSISRWLKSNAAPRTKQTQPCERLRR